MREPFDFPKELRCDSVMLEKTHPYTADMLRRAADEFERLRAQPQETSEPVAWRWKPLGGVWAYRETDNFPDGAGTLQPLYAAPPPPSPPQVREALRHAEARFECLAEEFEKAGDTTSWAMCSVDAERMGRALAAVEPAREVAEELERTLAEYDQTIERSNDDGALSDTGRETIINACIASKAAVGAFAERLAHLPAPVTAGVREISDIARELRDDYPAVDVTTAVFSRDFAGVGCCVIPQDRVLAIIKTLEELHATSQPASGTQAEGMEG